MNLNSNKVTHIVVDMLYDFIDGTLACSNAIPAVESSIRFINDNPNQKVIYIADCHPENHCSFTCNGGTWPPHCIAGTKGQQIHADFSTKIKTVPSHPNKSNIFKKGEASDKEEYSGFHAKNALGETVGEYLTKSSDTRADNIVVVSGIATEFCIKESVSDLLNSGCQVFILTEGLAYVDHKCHINTLKVLEEKGAKLL